MDNERENFSPDIYLDGLRRADKHTVEAVFSEFQPTIVRAITALGGSEAAGRVFFQTAVVEAARQARSGEAPEDASFFYYLKSLALTHFRDWLFEREQEAPPPSESEAGETDLSAYMPSEEQLRETRRNILAWRRPSQAGDFVPDDPKGKQIFELLRNIERRFETGAMASGNTRSANRILTYVVVGLICSLLGYFLYLRFTRAKTPAEVYGSNFNPPKSIVEDLHTRHPADMGNDSIGARPNECDQLLAEADMFYQKEDYEEAAARLSEILDDSTGVCHSDAYFYLGIIALQLDKPGITLQCFSKIEDLERYGEDLYWYQALAFVKLAAQNPALREKASGAVERALSNTQDPQRREQAEKMLQQLSQ